MWPFSDFITPWRPFCNEGPEVGRTASYAIDRLRPAGRKVPNEPPLTGTPFQTGHGAYSVGVSAAIASWNRQTPAWGRNPDLQRNHLSGRIWRYFLFQEGICQADWFTAKRISAAVCRVLCQIRITMTLLIKSLSESFRFAELLWKLENLRLLWQMHNILKFFPRFDEGTRVTLLDKPNLVILVGDIYKLVSNPKMHQAPKASFWFNSIILHHAIRPYPLYLFDNSHIVAYGRLDKWPINKYNWKYWRFGINKFLNKLCGNILAQAEGRSKNGARSDALFNAH